jgi:hypothetical protein
MSSSNKDSNSKLNLVNEDKEAQLHNYLGKIMLFPEDIQDNIIEEISMLPLCTKAAINDILAYYTNLENTELDQKKSSKMPN